MDIFVDGSYKEGKAGTGIIVLDRDILVERTGKAYMDKNSFNTELRAILMGLEVAERYDRVNHIMSDNKNIVETINNKLWKESSIDVYARIINKVMIKMTLFDGELKWIPRKYNKLANGMAKIMVSGFEWEKEISCGNKLRVKDSQDPMHWIIEDEIVSIHEGVFMCTCEVSKYLSTNKLNCRHIWAVKRKLNIVNRNGEGILSPFAEVLKMRI